MGKLVEESVAKAVADFSRLTDVAYLFTGGIYSQVIADNAQYPAALWKFPKTVIQNSFEGIQTERPWLHLEVYADDSGTAEVLCRKLVNRVTDAALPLTQSVALELYPRDLYHALDVKKGADGKRYFGTCCDLELWVAAAV